MKPRSPLTDGLITVLRTALPVALLLAGWSVYRQLPVTEQKGDTKSPSVAGLEIVLRRPANYNGPMDIAVELYPIDVSAAQREYLSKPHGGTTFEEFLKGRMSGRIAIRGRLDKRGQTILNIGEGDWWIVAQLSGDNEIEWRLPVKVAGRKQSVELTADNAYGRSKVF